MCQPGKFELRYFRVLLLSIFGLIECCEEYDEEGFFSHEEDEWDVERGDHDEENADDGGFPGFDLDDVVHRIGLKVFSKGIDGDNANDGIYDQ